MSETLKKPELLAPAGNFETLGAALDAGADAVYLGIGVLNLRAFSENFTVSDLPEIMATVRSFHARVYLVVNTMPNNAELGQIESFLMEIAAQRSRPHAIILSDPGVLRVCRRILPDMQLHLSTQTGTFNTDAAAVWRDLGITRIVLPREFSAEQIKEICRAEVCQTEVFVHGAMCVSISGRCLMGAWLNGRHPNHGECSQPCRLEYDITPRTGGKDAAVGGFRLRQSSTQAYVFNSKDLCTLEIIPDILRLGVDSLKIEGRNKSANYVATVTSLYRRVIDEAWNNPAFRVPRQYLDELDKLDHRPYTTGFIGGEQRMQSVSYAKEKSRIRVLGRVKALLTGGTAVVDVKNPFRPGEAVSLFPVNQKQGVRYFTVRAVQDLNGNRLERAVTNRLVTVFPQEELKLRVGDMLRREV
ncbi:MAG: U32 family peptidase [Fibrobacterota bacterium]